MKIVTFSDIHIRNSKRHSEYLKVFKKFYELLKEIKPDILIGLGDFGHTKCNISPEYVKLLSEFMTETSKAMEYNPYLIIMGNHDSNLISEKRLDSISPILNLVHKNEELYTDINLLSGTGAYFLWQNDIVDDGNLSSFNFVLKDCLDDKPLPEAKDGFINVLLYHGIVNGAKTQNGYKFEYGITQDELKKYDFAFLGDIHARQKLFDNERYQYCGSMIQQDFGEERDKGFLVWDIKDKNNFTSKFVKIPESTLFYSYDSYESIKSDIDNKILSVNNTPKFRILDSKGIPLKEKQELRNTLKNDYGASEIHIIPVKKELYNSGVSVVVDDVRKEETQNNLIREYYKGQKLEIDVEKITELNNSIKLPDVDVATGEWEILYTIFNNSFSFGKCEIDWRQHQNQIVGLFAPNQSGKSNTIASTLYGIYNSLGPDKNISKTIEVINDKEKQAEFEIFLRSPDSKYYKIYTTVTKNDKGDAAKQTIQLYETDSFSNHIGRPLGESVNETLKIIRQKFGAIESSVLTSISTQGQSDLLFRKKSSERKEILSEFLGASVFEEKHAIARPKFNLIESRLKELEKTNPYENLINIEKDIENNKQKLSIETERKEKLQKYIYELSGKVISLMSEVESLKKSMVGSRCKTGVMEDISIAERDRESITEFILKIEDELKLISEQYSLVKDEDYEGKLLQVKDKIKLYVEIENKINSKDNEIKLTNKDIENNKKKIGILDKLKCPVEYKTTCMFTEDAMKATSEMAGLDKKLSNLLEERLNLVGLNCALSKDELEKEGTKLDKLMSVRDKLSNKINELNSKLELNKVKEMRNKDLLKALMVELKLSEVDEESTEKIEKLLKEISIIKKEQQKSDSEMSIHDSIINSLFMDSGKLSSLRDTNISIIKELESLRESFYTYKYYTEAFSKNGIPLKLIKSKLNYINTEINKILSGLCNFRTYMLDDNDNIDIVIEDHKGSRKIGVCCGMERTLAAIAIRAALTNITPLAHPSLFVIDEGFGALDPEYIVNMNLMLRNLKNMFSTVLIITHVEQLKEYVDSVISLYVDDEGKSYISSV